MKRTLLLIIAVTAAACQTTSSQEGAATGTSALVDGTPEAVGVLGLVNDGATDMTLLDIDAKLDRRAAEGILAQRDGADGVFGSADDRLFDSIAEVDDVRWVGPSALGKLQIFASMHGFVPESDDLLGVYDSVDFSVDEAAATVALANSASEVVLDYDLALDARAVTSILAARPIATALQLSELYFVGASALGKLKNAAAPGLATSSAEMFSADLRAALVDHYGTYGSDIVASGGSDLQTAQAAVDESSVYPIEDSEEDPEGHDLETTAVFAHPDPTFPGSDNVWFGAYDRDSGELLNVYSFN